MDTIAKIKELFETQVKQCIKLYESIDSQTNSYDFEKSFRQTMNSFIQSISLSGAYWSEKSIQKREDAIVNKFWRDDPVQRPSFGSFPWRLQDKRLPSGTDVPGGNKDDL